MRVAVHKLGEFIERVERTNADGKYDVEDVRGVSNTKLIQKTKASMDGRDFTPFTVLNPREFIFNRRTTRNGERLGLGFNQDVRPYIFTEDYVAFRVKDESVLLPEYLYMLFLRDEFDRYVRWDSWGSATEFFNWENMQRVELPIPPIEEQRKAVEVWQGPRKMKDGNEQLAEPLMQLCRSYLEECKKKWPMMELGPMIHLVDETNLSRRELPVVGVNFQKEFMPTAANMDGIDTAKYKVMTKGRFVFSGMQTGRDVCIRIGLWNDENDALVSPAYSTFEVGEPRSVAAADEQSDATERVPPLLPEYLFLWFKRGEIDRLGWFYSDSSVRANLDWNRFCAIKIPLPPLDVQQAIVDVYRCASEAKKIAGEAEKLSRAICPALVRATGPTERAGARQGTAPTERGGAKQGTAPTERGRAKQGAGRIEPAGARQGTAPTERGGARQGIGPTERGGAIQGRLGGGRVLLDTAPSVSLPPVFEREWHDWIVKKDGQLNAFITYIRENPKRHWLRRSHRAYFQRVSEIAFLGRKWYGYGNAALLKLPIIEPFRCSRKWAESGAEWNAAVARASRIGPGGAGIGTFMSPCEKACGHALGLAGGRWIVLSPEGFGERWHPGRQYEKFCAEGRMLFLSLWPAMAREPTRAELYQRCHEMGDVIVAGLKGETV